MDMSKECADCGNERVMVCPNCDTRTAVDMDASRIDQAPASGGEKSPMQVIDDLRTRIAELEAELAEAKKYGAPQNATAIVKRKTNCDHNEYWTTLSGGCMACRAADAEAENKRLAVERDGAMAVLREIADTENPEHYGNARDALHAVKLRAEAAIAANNARAGKEDGK